MPKKRAFRVAAKQQTNPSITYYKKNASIFRGNAAASQPATDHSQDTCNDQSVRQCRVRRGRHQGHVAVLRNHRPDTDPAHHQSR